MAVTPGHGWPTPDLGSVADGPDAFSDLALAIEGTLDSKGLLSYTPAWNSLGTVQPVNPSARQGLYRVIGPNCYFATIINFGPSTSGGRGPLRVGLPVPASTAITDQFVEANLQIGTVSRWGGQGHILASANTWVNPIFPVSGSQCWQASWMAQDTTGTSGYPNDGASTVRNGGYVRICGTYIIA